MDKLKTNYHSDIAELFQRVIGIDDRCHHLQGRVYILEQFIDKSPNSKLERIDQLEKEVNALKQLKQCKHTQEEAKMPEPQEFHHLLKN